MTTKTPSATDRMISLLADPPANPDLTRGYLKLLHNPMRARKNGIGPLLMRTHLVPLIYEHVWRPVLTRVAKGPGGASVAEERRLAADWLGLAPGMTVLDVACGPGNFARDLARRIGDDGLLVGIDASETMLDRAVAENRSRIRDPRQARGAHKDRNVAYVLGDAVELPFSDGGFDAVCCFAALYFFAQPYRAIDHMLRVLRPGGRIAILTSHRSDGLFGEIETVAGRLAGTRMFDRNEIVHALERRGCTGIRQKITGAAQFVAAVKTIV